MKLPEGIFEKWMLSFDIRKGEKDILRIVKNGTNQVNIYEEKGEIRAEIIFSGRGEPILLAAALGENTRASIICRHYRVELWVNEELADEDWPIGTADIGGGETEGQEDIIFSSEIPQEENENEDVLRTFNGAQDFRPEGRNTRAGDCMPFYHDGTYHLFYLFDRRAHKSKWGLGAHQWAHISSKDLITWEEHPMAVSVDSQKEGSICTGSVVYCGGLYYAFYAVRMCDGTPAAIEWAVSKDCIHFEKTHRRFELNKEKYNAAAARDPKVFKDSNGLFHMMVTTSLYTKDGEKGCLAHMTSSDLEKWEEAEPVAVLDIADQPECSDWFYFNGSYYLVYSNFGTAHYFISKDQFGPWEKPENNVVVKKSYRVPKCAVWKDERAIFAGTPDNGTGFGGVVHFYEAKQNPDGSLYFTDVPEMS